jgi:hypothetical protein
MGYSIGISIADAMLVVGLNRYEGSNNRFLSVPTVRLKLICPSKKKPAVRTKLSEKPGQFFDYFLTRGNRKRFATKTPRLKVGGR